MVCALQAPGIQLWNLSHGPGSAGRMCGMSCSSWAGGSCGQGASWSACTHFLCGLSPSHHCNASYLNLFVSCCNTGQCCFVQSSLLMPFGNGVFPFWIGSEDGRAWTTFQPYRCSVCKEWGPNLRWQKNQLLKVPYKQDHDKLVCHLLVSWRYQRSIRGLCTAGHLDLLMCVFGGRQGTIHCSIGKFHSLVGVGQDSPSCLSIPVIQRLLQVCKTYLELQPGVAVTGCLQQELGSTEQCLWKPSVWFLYTDRECQTFLCTVEFFLAELPGLV